MRFTLQASTSSMIPPLQPASAPDCLPRCLCLQQKTETGKTSTALHHRHLYGVLKEFLTGFVICNRPIETIGLRLVREAIGRCIIIIIIIIITITIIIMKGHKFSSIVANVSWTGSCPRSLDQGGWMSSQYHIHKASAVLPVLQVGGEL